MSFYANLITRFRTKYCRKIHAKSAKLCSPNRKFLLSSIHYSQKPITNRTSILFRFHKLWVILKTAWLFDSKRRGLALLNPYTSGFFVIWQKFKSHPCLVYETENSPHRHLHKWIYDYKSLNTSSNFKSCLVRIRFCADNWRAFKLAIIPCKLVVCQDKNDGL